MCVMPQIATPPPPFRIERDSHVPAFEQLKDALERHVLERLNPGDLFYSDSQVATSSGLSRSTVVKVIGMLVNDGLLRRSHGRGTFVAERKAMAGARIAVIFKERVLNPYTYTRDILLSLTSRTAPLGATVSFFNIESSSWESVQRQTYFAREGAFHRYIIIAPTREMADELAALPEARAKTILIGMNDPRFCRVDVDNAASARAAAHFVLGNGHRHIAFVGESRDRFPFVGERLAGFSDGLAGGGLALGPSLFFDDFDEPRRQERFAAWMQQQRASFTCLFAASASVAATVLRHARTHGLRIPEDLSLLVFDDVPGIGWDLSCICQPLDAIGEAALAAAVDRSSGLISAQGPMQIVLKAELRDRGSVARLPATSSV